MLHFAIIVGFLHRISQGVVNQPLSIGVIEIGRWASTDFKKYEESKVHRTAALQYVEAKRMQEMVDSISQHLSRAYSSGVQLNRRNVRRLFELILLFGRVLLLMQIPYCLMLVLSIFFLHKSTKCPVGDR